MADPHDLAAPYVVDALSETEREAFEAHLGTCASCRRDVAELSEGVVALAEHTAQTPPPHLKAQILARIDQADEGAAASRARRRWNWRGAFAAAAILAVVFAGLLVAVGSQLGHARAVAAVFAADDAMTLEVDSAVGAARFVYSTSLSQGVFVDSGLAEPSGDRVYELWLIDETGPRPAGIVRPGTDGVSLVEDVQPGLTLAMTEEPEGGSSQPTGDVLFTAGL